MGPGETTAILESFETLSGRFSAMRRKRHVAVLGCVGSALVFCGVFVGLGIMGVLKPPILAYAVGLLILVMDLVAALIVHWTQGRALARLQAEIAARFPGMPVAS